VTEWVAVAISRKTRTAVDLMIGPLGVR